MKNQAVNSGNINNENKDLTEEEFGSMVVDFEELSSSPEQYIQTLVAALGSPDERVRKYAFEVMCELCDERAVKILTLYLDHKDNLVRYSVKKALEAVIKKCPGRFEAIIKRAPLKISGKNYWLAGLSAGALLAVSLYMYHLSVKNDYQPSAAFLQSKEKRINMAAAGEANFIKYDEKGTPIITVKGMVSSYNSIKREAVIELNSYGDSCKILFEDSMKVDFSKGAKLVVEAEILHNDNINPLLLRAKSYKRPAAGY